MLYLPQDEVTDQLGEARLHGLLQEQIKEQAANLTERIEAYQIGVEFVDSSAAQLNERRKHHVAKVAKGL